MERLQELMVTSLPLKKPNHKTSKKFPLDDVFLQAKVNLQVVLKLGANLEVKWKQDEARWSGASCSFSFAVFGWLQEREESGFCVE